MQNAKSVTPLHCIASYPANIIDSNLGYIDYLEKSSIQKLDFQITTLVFLPLALRYKKKFLT